jgi:MtrB/PioB family decaheme-associated outer membrane protein
MRTLRFLLTALLSATPAAAQQPAAPQPRSPTAPAELTVPASSLAANSGGGDVTFGARLNRTGDVGRFFRYDDLRSGPMLERFRYVRNHREWAFSAGVFNAGYRDQQYGAVFERHGRLRASFDYVQTPLWFGNVEQTPYREETPGVFRLNDTIQASIQGGTATLAAYAPELQGVDMRLRRDTATGRLDYTVGRDLDLSLLFTSTKRTGEQPWGAPFGLSNTTVLPLSIDRRSNDLTAAAEWKVGGGSARLAYDGSFFNNDIEAVVWDNPLRFTDANGPTGYTAGNLVGQGRMTLPPDSTAHTVSGSWSMTLPRRSRLFAYVSLGAWLQNDRLLPFTINTSIVPIQMPRDTAEAKAVITSMNYRYTTRPTANSWLSASYRLYDFDNQSEPFSLTNVVRVDATVAVSPLPRSEPFGYKRQFADLDASYTRFRNVALRAGYGVEHDNRTYRYLERTTDHQVRASVDSTGFNWGSVRLQYDYSLRTGSGLDEQVFEDINEQQSLRQFDIANRTRNRISAIVQYLPTNTVGLSATGSLGRERRPQSAFGLQDNDMYALTFGVDYTPITFFTGTLQYSFERYATLQRSRQANPPPDPTFADPGRDWSTDMNEHVHTFSIGFEFPQIVRNTALRVGYDDVHDYYRYVYELAPDSTLAPVQQLPRVLTHFSFGTAHLRYTLSRQLGVGLGYRLDNFDTGDFALTPGIMNTPLIPTFLNLQYQWRRYTTHTGFVRVFYSF